MLSITIINDNTGTDENANYTHLVRSNYKVVASGRVIGHSRADGWRVLALRAIAPGILEACKAALGYISDDMPTSDEQYAVMDDVEDMLRAAIAKTRSDE